MNTKEVEIISADISDEEVKKLIEENYGIIYDKSIRLNGYDDLNFHILPPIKLKNNRFGSTKVSENGYIMKIINDKSSSDTEFLTVYVNILLHLRNERITCPFPVENNQGKHIVYWSKKGSQSGKEVEANSKSSQPIHAVLLLEFITGSLLGGVKFDEKLCYFLGQRIGDLHSALRPFADSQTLRRPHFLWSLNYVEDALQYIDAVDDEKKRSLAIASIEDFQKYVLTQIDALEQGIIHGDINKENVIISPENDPQIRGIIDFCDVSYSCYLFELAITITYLCLDDQDHLENFAASLISGYRRDLTDLELDLLKICICARLSQSLILGLYTYKLHPTNTYLMNTQQQGWPFLEKLKNSCNEKIVESIKSKIAYYRQQFS